MFMKSLNPVRILWILTFCLSWSLSAAEIKPALWKVGEGENASYLFGSVHLGKASWYPLPKNIQDAFVKTDKLVVEVLDSPSDQQKMMQAMMQPPGKKLSDFFSKDGWKQFSAYMLKQQMPPEKFQGMKPWGVSIILTMSTYMRLGYMPNVGVDKFMLDQALKHRKETMALESFDFQLDLLQKMIENEKDLLMMVTFTDEEYRALMEAWPKGDMAAIERISKEQMNETQLENFLYSRNRNWLKQLKPKMQKKEKLFVVVGAAHMMGDNGLPALLKKEGLKVTRLQ